MDWDWDSSKRGNLRDQDSNKYRERQEANQGKACLQERQRLKGKPGRGAT